MKNPFESLFSDDKKEVPDLKEESKEDFSYIKNIKEKFSSVGKTAILASLSFFATQKMEAQNFTKLSKEEMDSRLESLVIDPYASPQKIKEHFGSSPKQEKIVLVKRDANTKQEYSKTTYEYDWKPGEGADTLSYIKIFPSFDVSGEYDTLKNMVVINGNNSMDITSLFEGDTVTVLNFDSTGILVKDWNMGESYFFDRDNSQESGNFITAGILSSHFSRELRNILEGAPETKEKEDKEKKKFKK